MEAEIIAVGTELLLGDILNTNAQFLARQLADLGITVLHQHVVGDNAARLEELVRTAKARSDLLVFSGGLGPTADDLTKETVARCYHDTLHFDREEMDKITSFFAKSGRTTPDNNEKQAMVPTRGKKLPNRNGTAPGVWFEDEGRYAVLLPGPPHELIPLWNEQVLPLLQPLCSGVLHSLTLKVTGPGESHLEETVGHLFRSANPTAAIYAKTCECHIRITAKAATPAEAAAMCRAKAQEFYDILGDCIYGEDDATLESAAVAALQKHHLTLATAESCTGGLVSRRITDVPGASEVFGFGFVTYANEAKEKLLGVPGEVLAAHGAVSPQTAAWMAQGARRVSGADISLALTGLAGPGGGTPDKPVGLVYLAAAYRDTICIRKLGLGGRSREVVRLRSSQNALDLARRLALGLPLPDDTQTVPAARLAEEMR